MDAAGRKEKKGLSPSPRSRAPPPACGRSSPRVAARRKERGAAVPAWWPAGRPLRCPWPRCSAPRCARPGRPLGSVRPPQVRWERRQQRGVTAPAPALALSPIFASPWRWGSLSLLSGKASRLSFNRAAMQIFKLSLILFVVIIVSVDGQLFTYRSTAFSFSPSKIPEQQSSRYPFSTFPPQNIVHFLSPA